MSIGVLFAVRSSALAIATSLLVLTGCGAHRKPVAAPAPSADYEWSGFNGGNEAPTSAKQNAAPETKGSDEKPEKSDVKAVAVAGEHDAKLPAHATEAPRKLSATKIGGQSVSDVSAEAVATAAQRATKRNLVSSTVIVGSEYEQVSIVLESLAVQIVRPAAAPDQSGPKVRSPKARKEDIADTNAALYDPKADVLVLVQADKKATSARALAAIVSARDNGAPAKKPARAKPRRST